MSQMPYPLAAKSPMLSSMVSATSAADGAAPSNRNRRTSGCIQRDDGGLGEVFIHWGTHGSSAAGRVSSCALALSLGRQHHVPLAELVRRGLDQFFVPNGHTEDPEIPRVRSAVDYIARRLAIDWLPHPERAELGVYTLTERVPRASTWITACEQAARRSAPPAPRRGWRGSPPAPR